MKAKAWVRDQLSLIPLLILLRYSLQVPQLGGTVLPISRNWSNERFSDKPRLSLLLVIPLGQDESHKRLWLLLA